MSYNGWRNYETWLVNLWLDNDGAQMALEEICGQMYSTKSEFDEADFAEVIESYVDEMREASGVPDSGLFGDLIGAALREVDWREIASHYADNLPEDEEEPNPEDEEEPND